MAFNTVVQQGSFTSDGETKLLSIRSDVDWMCVYNFTNAAAQDDNSVEFYWQRGMADEAGIRWFKDGAGDNLNLLTMTDTGFTLLNTSNNPFGALVAVTASTDAAQPVVSTGDTGTLVDDDIVILSSMTGQESLGGIAFQIDTLIANTSFRIKYRMANAPGAAATAGNYRQIKFDPRFFPRRRFVANISVAAQAVITCTVDHGLSVGQVIRMVVPAIEEMVEMDGLQGTILAVTANTLTLDIDSSAFTAFTFALPGDVPFSPALVVPLGEDTGAALAAGVDILSGATDNQNILGMSLPGGEDSPGGADGDVMFWRAGKSFSVNNEV